VKTDNAAMFRMETTTQMAQEFGGQKMETSSKMLLVDDGEFQYTLAEAEQMPQPYATKAKSDPSKANAGGKAMFDQMRKQYNLKLMPDATVDGQAVYVIEATMKTDTPSPITKFLLHFSKDSGIAVKMVGMDPEGKTVQTTTYSDIKLNAKISPDRFKFKAPDGVQVMDMTGSGG
jgi:outer membrane lipoprotein-sorting protein